jgi:ABC-type antimicrobial peptide transport system permease subunit
VLWEVLSEGGKPVLMGLALGLVGAAASGRALRGLLFGVAPGDPVSLAAVVSVLALAAVAALAGPALRATRVDPAVALRQD